MPLKPTIQVLYSCVMCGIQDRKVVMEARGEETAAAWTKKLAIKLKGDHSMKSPLCRAKELSKVKVPVADAPDYRVGEPIAPPKEEIN